MKNIILPKDYDLIEESDLKSIEGGCLLNILTTLTGGTSGDFSLNNMFNLMSLAMNLFNTLGGYGLDSLSSGSLGIVDPSLFNLGSSLIPTTASATSTSC